jgi:hypothetical protein
MELIGVNLSREMVTKVGDSQRVATSSPRCALRTAPLATFRRKNEMVGTMFTEVGVSG